jgi:hypothetical protein
VVFGFESYEFFEHLRRFHKIEHANGNDEEDEEDEDEDENENENDGKDQENHYGLLVTVAHSFTKLLTKNDFKTVHCGVVGSRVLSKSEAALAPIDGG